MRLPQLLLLLAAAPLALWQLRTWWEANTQAGRELLSGTLNAASKEMTSTPAVWMSILRMLPLSAALASALSSAPHAQLTAAALAAVSLIPVALATCVRPATKGFGAKTAAQAAECLVTAAPLLLPVLVADCMMLIAAAATSASVALPAPPALLAGAALGAALTAIVAGKHFAARMLAWQAAEGDTAEVHITIRSDMGAVIGELSGDDSRQSKGSSIQCNQRSHFISYIVLISCLQPPPQPFEFGPRIFQTPQHPKSPLPSRWGGRPTTSEANAPQQSRRQPAPSLPWGH